MMPPNLPVCGKLFHNTSKALLLLLKSSPLTLKLWIKEELSEMSDPKTLLKLFHNSKNRLSKTLLLCNKNSAVMPPSAENSSKIFLEPFHYSFKTLRNSYSIPL